MAEEIPLSGGNVALGVVRVADTVRKPVTPFDCATTSLLQHLKNIPGCPRPMGYDDNGRRVLSWVVGHTDFPKTMWSGHASLASAAALLRKIHDASVPLVKAKHTWAYTAPAPWPHEVICHNDFAPYNMTFGPDGDVIGAIDFDLAGPGPRLRDLAYLAWWMLPLGQQDVDMAEATHRTLADNTRWRTLFASYGIAPDPAILPMIAEVLRHMGDPDAAAAMIGRPAANKLRSGGHFTHWQRAAQDFEAIRGQLAAQLRG